MRLLFLLMASVMIYAGLFPSEMIDFGTVGLISVSIIIVSVILPANKGGMAFDTIPIQDARAVYTKALVAVYREMPMVMSFFRSFFKVSEVMTKNVSIEVQRGSERVAVDVQRGTAGNRNLFSRSTEKIFTPPFYDEYFVANELDVYDVAIGTQDMAAFTQLAQESARKMMVLKDKIDRAVELQCSQALETGVIQLEDSINIDFKRKAGSLESASGLGGYWTVTTVDPNIMLQRGADFLRKIGKSQGGVINVIFGSDALSAYLNNPIVQARADLRNIKLMDIAGPQKDATGGNLHGEITVGSYIIRIWSYVEVYEDSTGTTVPYMNPKKIIMIPEQTQFTLSYALVPQLIRDGQVPQKGAYLIQDFVDFRETSHEVHIKSAPIAIPVKIDQIYTAQVVA